MGEQGNDGRCIRPDAGNVPDSPGDEGHRTGLVTTPWRLKSTLRIMSQDKEWLESPFPVLVKRYLVRINTGTNPVLFLQNTRHVVPGLRFHDDFHEAVVFQVQQGLFSDLVAQSVRDRCQTVVPVVERKSLRNTLDGVE